MKTCAIICEFNPLHSGHKYLLDTIKQYGYDRIVCFMSGNFVQRAEPAFADKYERAICAIKCGAAAVFELPTPYATANAQIFAYGGIKLVSSMKIENLAFGIESENVELIIDAAKLQSNETDEFKNKLKEYLSLGISYPTALSVTTSDILSKKYPNCHEELSKPNNILGISYLRAIYMQNAKINPILIKRKGSAYNDENLTQSTHPSATAIRKYILDGNDKNNLTSFLPAECINMNFLNKENYQLYEKIVIYTLRNCTSNFISQMADAGEGIENKLIKNANIYTNLHEIIEQTKSKRYTYSRIKRLCLQTMLDINNHLDLSKPISRLLAIKKESMDIIKNLSQEFYVKVSDVEQNNEFIKIEKKADSLYDLILGRNGNSFYDERLRVI